MVFGPNVAAVKFCGVAGREPQGLPE